QSPPARAGLQDIELARISERISDATLRYSATPSYSLRPPRQTVRFLQRSANLSTQSHCRADFLLRCHEVTTDGGGEWLATSLMSPSTGLPAQKKRGFSRIK